MHAQKDSSLIPKDQGH